MATGGSLKAIHQLLMVGVPRHSLLLPNVESLARKIFTNFRTRLGMLSSNNQWLQAHTMTAQFRNSPGIFLELEPDNLQPKELLNDVFPNWRAWAKWKPSLHRLHLWVELRGRDSRTLQDLLALEGPDFMIIGCRRCAKDFLLEAPAYILSAEVNCTSIQRAPYPTKHQIC